MPFFLRILYLRGLKIVSVTHPTIPRHPVNRARNAHPVTIARGGHTDLSVPTTRIVDPGPIQSAHAYVTPDTGEVYSDRGRNLSEWGW